MAHDIHIINVQEESVNSDMLFNIAFCISVCLFAYAIYTGLCDLYGYVCVCAEYVCIHRCYQIFKEHYGLKQI